MGIVKANVGTNWDTVGINQTPGMADEYKAWAAQRADELGNKAVTKEYAHAAFITQRQELPEAEMAALERRVYNSAMHHMTLFKMQDTANAFR
jgi:hypothetical protein